MMCGTGTSQRGTLECPQDCNAHGTCKQGICHCHIGYVGSTCEQRICWDSSQCRDAEVCHSSGECLVDGSDTSRGFGVPPPPGPTPPAPPPGFYVYGDWSACPETCTAGESTRTRTAACGGGDCTSLEAPVVSSPCPPQPCIGTACSAGPCGDGNLCSAQEVDGRVEMACVCVGGSTGDFCEADQAGCHMDADGRCCPDDQALAITGDCCRPGMGLDRDGRCCWESALDPCGVCDGLNALVDSHGNCCPVSVVDADGFCCMEAVDGCGALPRVASRVRDGVLQRSCPVQGGRVGPPDHNRTTNERHFQVSAGALGRHAWRSSCWPATCFRAPAPWPA